MRDLCILKQNYVGLTMECVVKEYIDADKEYTYLMEKVL